MNDMTYARDLPDLYADVAAVPGGVDAFAVVSNNLPGKPLVYNGQETGLDHRLDDGVRVTTQPDFAESAHRRFYATLLRLYRESEALSRGQYTELQTRSTSAGSRAATPTCSPAHGPGSSRR